MSSPNNSENTKVVLICFLCFALTMLVIAAFRVSDPVVGARWEAFIQVGVAVTAGILLALGGWGIEQRRRAERQLRAYYRETHDEKPELPVTPGALPLRQSPTQPS